MKKFNINQIVAGKVCGMFVVLGYGFVAGKEFVIVKRYCPISRKALRGELAMDEDALVNAW